jgi:lipopolysaccharide transport system permease protein
MPDASWCTTPAPTTLRGRGREVLEYAYFLPTLALEALRRRYRRTLLGWPWLIVRPLATALAGTLLFAGILGVQTDPVPYVLFFSVGMAAWSLVAVGVLWCTRSLEINRRLLGTLYFPRSLLPVSHLAPALVEFAVFFAVAIALVAGFAAFDRYPLPDPASIVYLVLALGYGLALVLAIGWWTAVLGARNRDLRLSLAFVTQGWLYATPVIYPLSAVPEDWRWAVSVNPATLLVVLFRRAVLGQGEVQTTMVVSAVALVIPLFVGGLWFFHRSRVTELRRV